jgi:hypothetical protein
MRFESPDFTPKIGQRNEHFITNLVQFVTPWARILKLFFKTFVLQFKVSVVPQKRRVLLLQRRNLLRQPGVVKFDKANSWFLLTPL